MTLGLPANVVMALLLGALMIHGIRPGPMLIQEQPELFWGLVTSMYVGNVMLLVLNLPLIPLWVRLLSIPYRFLFPLILLFCIVGAYSIRNSVFDVGMMIFFGVLGYILRKGGFPAAPLVLALILGRMLEQSVQASLKTSGADPMMFIDKPISASLLSGGLLVILLPIFKWVWKKLLVVQK